MEIEALDSSLRPLGAMPVTRTGKGRAVVVAFKVNTLPGAAHYRLTLH